MGEIVKISELKPSTSGIYKMTYPNGKIYIGYSCDIKRRMWEHNNLKSLKDGKKPQRCEIEMKKLNIKFDEIEILEYVPDTAKLGEKEKYWIAYYNSYKDPKKGYNSTPGGDNGTFFNEDAINATFKNEEVLDIRKRRFLGERKRDVYQDYLDHPFGTFEKVWLGKGYPEIGKEYIIPVGTKTRQEYSSIANTGENNNKAKLNKEMVKEIRTKYQNGKTVADIQKDYPFVTKITIRRVCNYETWKNV